MIKSPRTGITREGADVIHAKRNLVGKIVKYLQLSIIILSIDAHMPLQKAYSHCAIDKRLCPFFQSQRMQSIFPV